VLKGNISQRWQISRYLLSGVSNSASLLVKRLCRYVMKQRLHAAS